MGKCERCGKVFPDWYTARDSKVVCTGCLVNGEPRVQLYPINEASIEEKQVRETLKARAS